MVMKVLLAPLQTITDPNLHFDSSIVNISREKDRSSDSAITKFLSSDFFQFATEYLRG